MFEISDIESWNFWLLNLILKPLVLQSFDLIFQLVFLRLTTHVQLQAECGQRFYFFNMKIRSIFLKNRKDTFPSLILNSSFCFVFYIHKKWKWIAVFCKNIKKSPLSSKHDSLSLPLNVFPPVLVLNESCWQWVVVGKTIIKILMLIYEFI